MAKPFLVNKLQNRVNDSSIDFLANGTDDVLINLIATSPTDNTNITFNATTLISTEDVTGSDDSASISIQTGAVDTGVRGDIVGTAEYIEFNPQEDFRVDLIGGKDFTIRNSSDSDAEGLRFSYGGIFPGFVGLQIDGNSGTEGSAAILLRADTAATDDALIAFLDNTAGYTTVMGQVGYVHDNLNAVTLMGVNGAVFVETFGQNSPSANSTDITVRSGNALGTTSDSGTITIQTGTATGTRGDILADAKAVTVDIENDQKFAIRDENDTETFYVSNFTSGVSGIDAIVAGLKGNATHDNAIIFVDSNTTSDTSALIVQQAGSNIGYVEADSGNNFKIHSHPSTDLTLNTPADAPTGLIFNLDGGKAEWQGGGTTSMKFEITGTAGSNSRIATPDVTNQNGYGIEVTTGTTTTSGNSGSLNFETGLAIGNTGSINIETGNTVAGTSGSITLTTGSVASTRGNITLDANAVLVDTTLSILETGTSPQYYTKITGGDQSVDIPWKLPASQGGAGTYLQNDGSGNLTWATGTGTTSPGGLDTYVQFNDSGSFGGDSGLVYNKTTDLLTGVNIDATKLGILESGATPTYHTYIQGADQSGDIPWTLPASQGGSGTFLQNDGNGNLTWASASGAPGGLDTYVQFNDGGSFGGDAELTYNKTTDTLNGVNINATKVGVLESGASPTYYTYLQGGDQTGSDITYTLPTAQATGTQYLQNNGSGVLSWATVAVSGTYAGSVAATNGVNTQSISIGTDVLTTNYSPSVILRNTSGDDHIHVMVTTKSSTAFTVEYSATIPNGNYDVDWIVILH